MLSKIDLFSTLTKNELTEIEKLIIRVPFNRGDYVFKQGDFSRDFYIIQNGQVELSMKDFFKENKSIAFLKSGEFFGEMALFDKNLSRSLDAQILQSSLLLKIPGDDFEKLLSEKPALSFKILGALSKRLKEANDRRSFVKSDNEKEVDGKIIAIASPRNGYGKTTFSTTAVHLLSNELGKRILYIDLDLYFGDGTFALGVFSQKSILAFTENFKNQPPTWQLFQKYLVELNDNLYILPAPKDFIEGEKVNETDLAAILKSSRKFFDYIVVDTDSAVSEVFFTTVDIADQVLFILDVHCGMSIKSNVRYFRGISALNLAAEKCSVLVTKAKENFLPEDVRNQLSYKLIGVLPEIKDITLDYGQSIYHLAPKGTYCEALRTIFKSLFKTTWLPRHSENGFFYRLLFPTEPTKVIDAGPTARVIAPKGKGLEIANENCSTLVTFLRSTIAQGNWDQAYSEAMNLLDIFPNSPEILQLLGEVGFYLKNFQVGIDALQKTLFLDPENHYAMGILGVILLDEKLKKKSLEILRSKIGKNPESSDLHSDLGKLLFSVRDFPGAQEAFQMALKLNPEFSEAQVNLAVTYGEVQDYPEAISQLIQIEQKNIRIYYLLGSFLFDIGCFSESFEAFSKVAGENPHYLDVAEKLNSLEGYFQKLSNLLKMHRDLVKSSPHSPDLPFKIGNILVLMGKQEEAVLEFQKALDLNPNHQDAKVKIEETRSWKSFDFQHSLPVTGLENPDDHFTFELFLEKLPKHAKETNGCLPDFSMMVKNVRLNTVISGKISSDAVQSGTIFFDCHSIGPILANDLLLVQIKNDTSKSIFASFPHIVSEDERKHNRALKIN